MTANTPTPAELLTEALEHIEHVVDSLPESMREPTARGEGADERLALLIRVTGALEIVTAERDALAAQVAEAARIKSEPDFVDEHGVASFAHRMALRSVLASVDSALILAQRDARVLREFGARQAATGAIGRVIDLAARTEAERIERDAQ